MNRPRILQGLTYKQIGYRGVFFFGAAILFGWLATEYPPVTGMFVTFSIFFAWGAGIHHVYAIPPKKREF